MEFLDTKSTQECCLIGEYYYDCKFFRRILSWFKGKNGITLPTVFEDIDGGGDDTYKKVKQFVGRNKRPTLCIVDSDRRYPEQTIVETLPANADIVWPSLYIAKGMLSIKVILLGFIIELFFVKYFTKTDWKKALTVTVLMNLITTILGIIFIPLSGLGSEFIFDFAQEEPHRRLLPRGGHPGSRGQLPGWITSRRSTTASDIRSAMTRCARRQRYSGAPP